MEQSESADMGIGRICEKKVEKRLVDKVQLPEVRLDTEKRREIVCKVERFKDRSAVLTKGLNCFYFI